MTLKTRAELLADTVENMPTGVTAGTSAQDVRDAIAAVAANAPNFKEDKIFSLRAYGADCTGASDCSTIFNALLADVTEGSVIDLPAGGTVLMRSYVTIPVDHLTIRGNGCKIISDATGQDRKFNVVGRTGIKFFNLRVDGLGLTTLSIATAFDTYRPETHPGTIHFIDSTECDVKDCNIRGVNWPVTLLGACERIRINDNTFFGYYAAVYGYFSTASGNPQPRSITISSNFFLAGLHATFDEPPPYWGRNYPPVDAFCSGAVKFRGSETVKWNFSAGHVISGNIIRAAGQMGVELQGGMNDCSVSLNTMFNVGTGVSLSYVQRCSVADNIIKNAMYAGIEVDGRTDYNELLSSNDEIALDGNIIDGRDEDGRPVNWVNNYGIVVSHVSRGVSISSGSIKYMKTGVCVMSTSSNVLIDGVKITTNEESGYGGMGYWSADGMPYVQGVLVLDSHDVRIRGCSFDPSGTAWQRMVNIINSHDVAVEDCTIVANNTCVYVFNGSNITIDKNKLKTGSNLGGSNKSFVTVDSSQANCSNIKIRRNNFIGANEYGILLLSPQNSVSPVELSGNNTREASCSVDRFLKVATAAFGSYIGGTRGSITCTDNVGPESATLQNSMNFPFIVVDGNGGTFADEDIFSEIHCIWGTTINLQTSVGYRGFRKKILQLSPFATVTINPKSGETINGSTGAFLLKSQFASVNLTSDGSNWIASVDIGGSGLKSVNTKIVSGNFGVISAGAVATFSFFVPCQSGVASKPNVIANATSALAAGLSIQQSIVTADNQVDVMVMNSSAVSITAGTIELRVTVFEY